MAGDLSTTFPSLLHTPDFLPAGKNLQAVAGERVVRLDAALVRQRQLAEFVDLHLAGFRFGQSRFAGHVAGEDDEHDQRGTIWRVPANAVGWALPTSLD